MVKRLFWEIALIVYIIYNRFKYSKYHSQIDYINPEEFTIIIKSMEKVLN